MRLPILQLSCRLFFFFNFGSLRLLAFPKAKIAVGREEICERDSHTVHKTSQRNLTAD